MAKESAQEPKVPTEEDVINALGVLKAYFDAKLAVVADGQDSGVPQHIIAQYQALEGLYATKRSLDVREIEGGNEVGFDAHVRERIAGIKQEKESQDSLRNVLKPLTRGIIRKVNAIVLNQGDIVNQTFVDEARKVNANVPVFMLFGKKRIEEAEKQSAKFRYYPWHSKLELLPQEQGGSPTIVDYEHRINYTAEKAGLLVYLDSYDVHIVDPNNSQKSTDIRLYFDESQEVSRVHFQWDARGGMSEILEQIASVQEAPEVLQFLRTFQSALHCRDGRSPLGEQPHFFMLDIQLKPDIKLIFSETDYLYTGEGEYVGVRMPEKFAKYSLYPVAYSLEYDLGIDGQLSLNTDPLFRFYPDIPDAYLCWEDPEGSYRQLIKIPTNTTHAQRRISEEQIVSFLEGIVKFIPGNTSTFSIQESDASVD